LRRASIRWRSAAAALTAAALLALAPGAATARDGRSVRVFAVQPKLDLAWMESRAAFRDKMLALSDRTARGPGAPLVQSGADDFASHLLGPTDPARPVETARDLVVWPEDVGLFAALSGRRAEPARNAGSLTNSIAALIAAYGPQNAYYSSKYLDVAARAPQVRLLALSLTDTFAHVAVETYSEIARRYRVWLEAGIDMAQDWKVVCDDIAAFNSARPARLPDGELCQEQNPQRVKQLGDPFEPRDYAYEAVTARPSNIALLFDPAGRLRSKQVKAYLTPTELPGQLDLVPGEIGRGLPAVRTPVGTLGFVTSKDSWMPDVQARLDQQHVDLLVQPEFFVGDTVDDTRMWSPDTMLASGYNDVLRMPSVQAMVAPDLVGNVFEFSADAQSHIAVKPRGARERRASVRGHLVGQPGAPGLAGVMPWVVPDPLTPSEPFPARRKRLAEAGRALIAGSGTECPDPARAGPCENGHVEGVLWRDVTVARRPRHRRYRGRLARTRFSRSRAVHPAPREQRNAAVAMRGWRGVVAWEERRGARQRVLLARTSDGGRHWSRPVRPTGRRPGAADELWPSVAIGARGRVTVAWGDDSTGTQRAYVAASADGGRRFGAPRALDATAPPAVAQWKPALAQGPGGVVHAVFVDERARSADDDLPQAGVYYARVERGVPGRSRRVDEGGPVPLAAKLDHAWAPRVAVRGKRVLVAWIDFQNYDWGVFSRASADGGASFGPQVRVTDNAEDDPSTTADEQREELADSPDPAFLAKGEPVVAWADWRKRDSAATAPHQQYDVFAAAPGAPNFQVDPHGAQQVSTFAPSMCASGPDALIAFQDASRAQSQIRLVRVRGRRAGRTALRVDDGGSRAGNAYRPRLACSRGRVTAVFETERDGPTQVYVARARSKRLG
jgi:hypothetical protein